MKNQNLKKIILSIVIIIALFLLFRTAKLTITYDALNENSVSYGTRFFSPMYKAASNITSIEQELINYEQRLNEIEEARKALQESKDKDWIANRQASLAKESERIKNQIHYRIFQYSSVIMPPYSEIYFKPKCFFSSFLHLFIRPIV